MAKLFMTLVGCTPSNRNIEQHDVFFGIGNSITDIIPDVKAFWPEGETKIHFDAWREVNKVGEYEIKVIEEPAVNSSIQLFFINLGGYKPQEFEEFHYKIISVPFLVIPNIPTSQRTGLSFQNFPLVRGPVK